MLGELFGTFATPLIFVGLAGLGILLTIFVRWLSIRGVQVPTCPPGAEPEVSDHGGLPKII
jgi:hypothetical protein